MTKDEIGVLLYLETCAVDSGGLVHHLKLNAEDHEIIKRWTASGYIQFGRVCFADAGAFKHANWVHLSDTAIADAARERKARAARLWGARDWRTAEEYRKRA